jgi:hypothetical protein
VTANSTKWEGRHEKIHAWEEGLLCSQKPLPAPLPRSRRALHAALVLTLPFPLLILSLPPAFFARKKKKRKALRETAVPSTAEASGSSSPRKMSPPASVSHPKALFSLLCSRPFPPTHLLFPWRFPAVRNGSAGGRPAVARSVLVFGGSCRMYACSGGAAWAVRRVYFFSFYVCLICLDSQWVGI